MKPFLLLATRVDDVVADAEYEQICRFGGLTPHELKRVRLEQTEMPEIDFNEFSGIIIGGGPFNASDDPATKSDIQLRVEGELGELVDRVVAADFPLLGACYGVGAVAAQLGSVVDATYGEDVGAVEITVTDEGRRDPLLADLPERFDAFVGHKEACRDVPPGAVLLASSATCPVQMFRYRKNLYVTQFHPELDVDGIVLRIRTYRDEGYFPAEEVERVVASVRGTTVDVPPRILRAFTQRYARP
ncbi:GMP synthase (glutamine-hydrolysing) [Micrococcales bacterium KH10]|nr:GMP synthase (glutamine-hydrolysing) [Micrococcales bacterium KH10]